MHFDHKYFKDGRGIVHATEGSMGQASSMYCEGKADFYLSMKELKMADAPVTCVQCLAVESRK